MCIRDTLLHYQIRGFELLKNKTNENAIQRTSREQLLRDHQPKGSSGKDILPQVGDLQDDQQDQEY